jgi:hypothetical protein
MLIGTEGARLLREDGAGGDPTGAKAPRRRLVPAESVAPGVEININHFTEIIKLLQTPKSKKVLLMEKESVYMVDIEKVFKAFTFK